MIAHRRPRRAAAALGALLITLLLALPALAAGPTVTLQTANRAFAEGRYQKAASDYETLIARRGDSAPLLFNLGNAYLRQRKLAPALLAYERARLLAPRDGAIAENLAQARAEAGLSTRRRLVEKAVHWLRLDSWTWIAVAGFWSLLVALAAAALWRRRRGLFVTVACLGGAVLGVAGFALLVGSRDLSRGLVMQSTPVLVSPFKSSDSAYSLAAGQSVKLEQRHGNFERIRDARGQSGWVDAKNVARLVP